MDAETSETVAGVVRWCVAPLSSPGRQSTSTGAGSPRQLLALGIDLAADEARNLLPDAIPIDGPAPVGAVPAALLRSAEQLLQCVATREAADGLHGLLARVANLVWEANSGVSD